MFEIEGDEDMKKYDKNGTCIKCGYGGIADVHKQKWFPSKKDQTTVATCGIELKSRPEHISRTCKNCGYSWRERPLDGIELPDVRGSFPGDEIEEALAGCDDPDDDDIKLAPGWDRVAAALGITNKALLNFFNRNKPNDPARAIVDEPGSTSEAIKEAMAKQVGHLEKLDSPVFEVGDILTVGEGDECEHEVLACPTDHLWCVSGYDHLFNKANLHDHFSLIRKGPKVITLEKVRGTDVAIYASGVQTGVIEIDGDKTYTITATEEE